MKRGLFINKSRYHHNKSNYADLQAIAHHFKQIASSGLEEGLQHAYSMINLLSKQQLPIRSNEFLDINVIFGKLFSVIIEDDSENNEQWVDLYLSCCYKQSYVIPAHFLQNCMALFEKKPSRFILLRFISYGIDVSSKYLPSEDILHFFSFLTSCILAKESEDTQLYLLLLCCSSICHCPHFACIKSAHVSELNELSFLCFNTIQTLPQTSLQLKIHSLCLHILSICIQHHAYHRQSSPLLSHITPVFLPTLHPSEELTKYIGNCIQFLRLSHQSVPNELDTLTDIHYLFSWICEWKGEVSVIHEALSSVRALFKELDKDWMEINESFTTSFLQFIQWSITTLQQESSVVNTTELLRTLQVCIKQTPSVFPPSVCTAYLCIFDLLLERVLTYQTTSRYPVQDMVISLTQCISSNAFNEPPTWFFSRIPSFPWKSLTSLVFSPFLPLPFQKVVAQFLNKCLLQFSNQLPVSVKQMLPVYFKLTEVQSLSVNGAVCLGSCLDGLALCTLSNDWKNAVQVLLFHPSSSVKERVLQSLQTLSATTLLQCSDLLTQSITEDTAFSPCFDQKLRLFLKLGTAFSYPHALLTHILHILSSSFYCQKGNSLIHTLQFISMVANSLGSLPPIAEWAAFILTCDEGVVREYIQLITKIAHILGMQEINVILKVFWKDDRIAKREYFPFLLSLLQYHAEDSFSGEEFIQMVVIACEDVTNMKQLLHLLHSFHQRPSLLDHHMDSILRLIEKYMESRRRYFSFLELVMTEEILQKCKEWIM